MNIHLLLAFPGACTHCLRVCIPSISRMGPCSQLLQAVGDRRCRSLVFRSIKRIIRKINFEDEIEKFLSGDIAKHLGLPDSKVKKEDNLV